MEEMLILDVVIHTLFTTAETFSVKFDGLMLASMYGEVKTVIEKCCPDLVQGIFQLYFFYTHNLSIFERHIGSNLVQENEYRH
jgi:hypothetical protein